MAIQRRRERRPVLAAPMPRRVRLAATDGSGHSSVGIRTARFDHVGIQGTRWGVQAGTAERRTVVMVLGPCFAHRHARPAPVQYCAVARRCVERPGDPGTGHVQARTDAERQPAGRHAQAGAGAAGARRDGAPAGARALTPIPPPLPWVDRHGTLAFCLRVAIVVAVTLLAAALAALRRSASGGHVDRDLGGPLRAPRAHDRVRPGLRHRVRGGSGKPGRARAAGHQAAVGSGSAPG